MKTCKGCNKELEDSKFYVAKKNKDGTILRKNYCRVCQTEKDRARYHALPTDRKKERNKHNREKLGKDYFKDYKLKKEYNIDLNEYHSMVKQQDNKCYICSAEFKDRSDTRVDHNHKTGEVRKILCHNCNAMLGHSKESISRLQNAIEYIKEHNDNI